MKEIKCCICGKRIPVVEGNNPYPVKKESSFGNDKNRCCHSCNSKFVIPYRLMLNGRTKKEVDDENYMKRQIHGNYTSLTPLGTAFELTTLVFLDAIVSELMEKMQQTESDLKARHTVLE